MIVLLLWVVLMDQDLWQFRLNKFNKNFEIKWNKKNPLLLMYLQIQNLLDLKH